MRKLVLRTSFVLILYTLITLPASANTADDDAADAAWGAKKASKAWEGPNVSVCRWPPVKANVSKEEIARMHKLEAEGERREKLRNAGKLPPESSGPYAPIEARPAKAVLPRQPKTNLKERSVGGIGKTQQKKN